MAGSAAKAANNSVLDVRGVQPPDNILTLLKQVSELPRGSSVEIRIDSNPFQLYDLLQQRGFLLELTPQADGGYRGCVKPRDIDTLAH